jgi:hypothetical protein
MSENLRCVLQNYNKVNDIAIEYKFSNGYAIFRYHSIYRKEIQLVKKRLIVAVRSGAYDPDIALHEIPLCFENAEGAQRAMESLVNELSGVADLELMVVNQTMVSIRYNAFGRYDETGDFPRLYPMQKDMLHGYVIQVDFPDDVAVRKIIHRAIQKFNLAIIDEGAPEDKVLEFIA